MIVDDDVSIRETLQDFLVEKGYEVLIAGSAEEGLNRIAEFEPDLIVSDVRMPGMDGLELLNHVNSTHAGIDLIIITAHEDMTSAVSAMKSGAVDYLVKPLDLDQIELTVEQCFRSRKLQKRAEYNSSEAAEPHMLDKLVGSDPRMIEIYKLIGSLGTNRATVLIRGETGTGKERIARAVHFNSEWAEEPFVAVNCTALSDTLLESELFGHIRGAFTGAVADRKGFFELAGSGTIFLDEIGDASPEFQAKLLRVLEEGEYYPVGGERVRHTDARVIAATHCPIEEFVSTGRFREDLYYRLRVVEIAIPPLREHPSDIEALAQHLLVKIRGKLHKNVRTVSDGLIRRLEEYSWPGNVRELETTLLRAAVTARGPVILEHDLALGDLEERSKGEEAPEREDYTLAAAESAQVQRALERTGGNKRQAARILGISRKRLDRLIAQHGLVVSKRPQHGSES